MVGEAIRRAREAAGLNQETLADKAGIERPSLSKIETGKTQPRVDTVEKVASALGMDVATLLAGGASEVVDPEVRIWHSLRTLEQRADYFRALHAARERPSFLEAMNRPRVRALVGEPA